MTACSVNVSTGKLTAGGQSVLEAATRLSAGVLGAATKLSPAVLLCLRAAVIIFPILKIVMP